MLKSGKYSAVQGSDLLGSPLGASDGQAKTQDQQLETVQSGLGTRGSLTIWMDESAIQQWHCHTHHGRRGRGFNYSDTAIKTALMIKGLFNLPLRALEGFINSLFKLMAVPQLTRLQLHQQAGQDSGM